jgi:hypothetical protein
MRMGRIFGLAAVCVVAGTHLGHSADAKQRIALKLTLVDGTQVRVTEVEGGTAEIKQAGSNGFHLGLISTYSKELVTVQIIELADSSRKPLARFTGPLGEPMEFWSAGKATDPPTLRIIPRRVY